MKCAKSRDSRTRLFLVRQSIAITSFGQPPQPPPPQPLPAVLQNYRPVTAERLESIKSHVKYDFAMGLDNADHVANMVSHYIKLTNDPESVNKVHALYDQVTPAEIMAVAKKYFTQDNRTVLLLTQQQQQQEVKQ